MVFTIITLKWSITSGSPIVMVNVRNPSVTYLDVPTVTEWLLNCNQCNVEEEKEQ